MKLAMELSSKLPGEEVSLITDIKETSALESLLSTLSPPITAPKPTPLLITSLIGPTAYIRNVETSPTFVMTIPGIEKNTQIVLQKKSSVVHKFENIMGKERTAQMMQQMVVPE